jgi:hypothetical protein
MLGGRAGGGSAGRRFFQVLEGGIPGTMHKRI